MPSAVNSTPSQPTRKPRRLVLCFDGTGNTFNGNTSDTNIVKIYNKLDRDDENQFHYYQTGIGTYDINGGSINKGFFGNIASNVSRTIDEGFGTSFDAHVMAGYRFLMRYYEEGDKIYMFGFSRGAFTARFLARMVYTVGLLSRGNEEMVPFAYSIYQDYEQGKFELEQAGKQAPKLDASVSATTTSKAPNKADNGTKTPLLSVDEREVPECELHDHRGDQVFDNMQQAHNKLNAFRDTFCRRDRVFQADGKVKYNRVKVYFLGIFDCVSSVAVLDTAIGKAPPPVSVLGTADHVRHAVALDERRVKFKAALLAQDNKHASQNDDIKEVWFPGNHGDVGGGWPAPKPTVKDTRSMWQRFKDYWSTKKDKTATENPSEDPFQMSDVALSWMIRELELVGQMPGNEDYALTWSEHLTGFKRNFTSKREDALSAPAHDTMRFGGGSSPFKVCLWNFMEWLPFLARWELSIAQDGVQNWFYEWWRPNRGLTRDIPTGAVFHDSVIRRLEHPKIGYKPQNNAGGSSRAVLPQNVEELQTAFNTWETDTDGDDTHTTYTLGQPAVVSGMRKRASGRAR